MHTSLNPQSFPPSHLSSLSPSTGLERNKDLSLFYRAACVATPGPVCTTSGTIMWHLSDPHDPLKPLLWPFLDAHVLVERDFYSHFLTDTKWLNSFSGEQRKFAVLGQPGIGKSAFGIWLLTQLLRSNRTVVYSRNFSKSGMAPDVKHFIFHRGTAFKTIKNNLGHVDKLLQVPSVVHLCDSIKPQGGDRCHKILISSPDPGVWRWFVLKEYARTAYFPLFNFQEMEALREAEFGSLLPPEILKLRVRAWGLSTRAVFSPNQQEVGADVVLAMSEKSLEELQKAMNEVRAPTGGAASDTPHALFMLNADRETLRSGGVTFRSEAVARRVVQLMASRARDTLIPVLQRLLDSSSTRSVAGTAFELAAIDVLGRGGGGEYGVRPLFIDKPNLNLNLNNSPTPKAFPWQTLPVPATMQRFGSLTELVERCESGEWDPRLQYFRPSSANLAAIDLIGPGLQLFQITVNRSSHDLKVTSGRSDEEGLLSFYRTLLPLLAERWGANPSYLDVCFVVPLGCGGEWRAQKLVMHKPKPKVLKGTVAAKVTEDEEAVVKIIQTTTQGGGKISGFSIDGKVVEVRQYLMEVPLSIFSDWLAMVERRRDAIDEASDT